MPKGTAKKPTTKAGNGRQGYFAMALFGTFLVIMFAVMALGVFRNSQGRQGPPAGTQQGGTAAIADLQQEIESLEKSLRTRPGDPELTIKLANARYDLGAVYLFQLGQEEQGRQLFSLAVDDYQRALAKEPANVPARVDMATAAFYCGRHDEAEEGFRRAIADDPAFPNARLNYGIFLFHARQDYKEALAQWQEVLNLNPPAAVRDRATELIRVAEKELAN